MQSFIVLIIYVKQLNSLADTWKHCSCQLSVSIDEFVLHFPTFFPFIGYKVYLLSICVPQL
uniref:Uncharacterized protein n=1 Tax=Rhizophora mucronata TaxID=61149 RepID=A0A2P2L0N6_RHIMU